MTPLSATARADMLALPAIVAQSEAAKLMIVLAVQQGISSLPPTSAQSYTYEFDPGRDTYVRSEKPGPLSFRAPQTLGDGKLSLRLAGSYFELPHFERAIPYLVSAPPGTPIGVGQLGLRLDGQGVGIVSIAAAYGLGNRADVTVNLPVVVVGADAGPAFSTRTNALNVPAAQAPFSGPAITNGDLAGALQLLDLALKPGGPLTLRTQSFRELGLGSLFNSGTHVGVGRISIGGKVRLYSGHGLDVAAVPEFFFPSPNEDQFSGSASAAILPRVVAAVRVAASMRLHVDAGYDYDFDHDELRHFAWSAGASIPLSRRALVDFGIGGSKFNSGIAWTPASVTGGSATGSAATLTALGDNRLGSNFVDFLGGVKLRITETMVLAGAVNVPINNEGYRAAAIGTVAVERYF